MGGTVVVSWVETYKRAGSLWMTCSVPWRAIFADGGSTGGFNLNTCAEYVFPQLIEVADESQTRDIE